MNPIETATQAISSVLTWQVLLFCLGVYAITFAIRTVVEKLVANKPTLQGWWKDVLLPTLPVLLGGLLAVLMSKYPFPTVVQSYSARVMFGVTCGFFSAWLYRILKKILRKLAKSAGPSSGPESK